ncbi:hypothetical protein INT47_011641 [Mucor saturninus]|uniref:Uncharacterized protein n=1 Tax=Mucor saturninus TaxID=64648 RepID=A0A8H7V5H7_9FUNG|nr:hypothetical protein INT47_011641 [Mucor saturninus]
MNNQNNASKPIDGQPESSQHGIVERGRRRRRGNGNGRCRGGRNRLGCGNQSGGQNEDGIEGSQPYRGGGWGQAETLLLIEKYEKYFGAMNSARRQFRTRIEDVPEDVPEDGVNLEPEVVGGPGQNTANTDTADDALPPVDTQPVTADDVRSENFFAVGEQDQPRTARRRLETHRVSTAAASPPAITTTTTTPSAPPASSARTSEPFQPTQVRVASMLPLPSASEQRIENSMLRVLDRVQQTQALERGNHFPSFLRYSRETNVALLGRSDQLAELFAESNRETARLVDAIIQDMANRNQQGQNNNNSDQ